MIVTNKTTKIALKVLIFELIHHILRPFLLRSDLAYSICLTSSLWASVQSSKNTDEASKLTYLG